VKKAEIRNSSRNKTILGSKTDDIVQTNSTGMIKYDMFSGQKFDGVLIQFFVEHLDKCETGDKVSAQVALKGVISVVLPDEERAISSDDPNEPIELIISPQSVISRMTIDFFMNLYVNKAIVGLKSKIQDIWES